MSDGDGTAAFERLFPNAAEVEDGMHSYGRSIIAMSALVATVGLLAPTLPAEARSAKPGLIRAHLRPDYVGAQGYAGGPPGPRVPFLIDPGHGFLIGFGVPGLLRAGLR